MIIQETWNIEIDNPKLLQVQTICLSSNSFQTKVVTIPDISIQTWDLRMMNFKILTVGFQRNIFKQHKDKISSNCKRISQDLPQAIQETFHKNTEEIKNYKKVIEVVRKMPQETEVKV